MALIEQFAGSAFSRFQVVIGQPMRFAIGPQPLSKMSTVFTEGLSTEPAALKSGSTDSSVLLIISSFKRLYHPAGRPREGSCRAMLLKAFMQ